MESPTRETVPDCECPTRSVDERIVLVVSAVYKESLLVGLV